MALSNSACPANKRDPVVVGPNLCSLCLQVRKTPPVTYFVKQALGIGSGSQRPGHANAGEISTKMVYEIAKVKQKDSPELSIEAICHSIVGICRSMGIKVKDQQQANQTL